MNVPDLTPDQGARLAYQLRGHYLYFAAICRRMEDLGYPPTHPLYREAVTVRAAIRRLYYQALTPCDKSASSRGHKWMRDR